MQPVRKPSGGRVSWTVLAYLVFCRRLVHGYQTAYGVLYAQASSIGYQSVVLLVIM
jgi:hypothetical protein